MILVFFCKSTSNSLNLRFTLFIYGFHLEECEDVGNILFGPILITEQGWKDNYVLYFKVFRMFIF